MSAATDLLADGVRAERAGAMDRALEAFRAAADHAENADVRAQALTHQADVLRSRCLWEESLAAANHAQEVARAARLPSRVDEAIIAQVNVFISRGDLVAAVSRCEQIVASSTDARMRGIALQNLGTIHAQNGQILTAERAFRESLGNFHKADYPRGEAIALNNLGRLSLDKGDAADAVTLLEQAHQRARDVEDLELVGLTGLNIAWAYCASGGDLERAQDLAMSAMGYFSGCNNHYREIECLRLIGEINERCQDAKNAERCYECALRLAEEIGSEVEVRATTDRLARLRGSQPGTRHVS